MTNLKKILGLTLAATMVIGMLSGCGKDTAKNDSSEAVSEANQDLDGADAAGQTDSADDAEQADGADDAGQIDDAADNTNQNADITILYTNDVHSYIANVVKDDEGNITGDGLRLSKVAAMVNDMRADGENVLLVDAGDEIQGDIYGAMDEGETIIDIMNATGYQLATFGNHEFDYGMFQLMKLTEKAEFPYVTCNFHSTKTKERTFADSHVFDIAGKKVAFVGITTPDTITSSAPAYFQDETGEFIYTIDGINNKNDLYTSVQNSIDNVREEADYVIGLGHLGIGTEAEQKGWDSPSVIANVSGLDAFIDGHSHTVIEGEKVKDKDGKEVILTQTGCYLTSIGKMTISEDGSISIELVHDYDREDEAVASIEKEWIDEVDAQMNEKAAVLDTPMYIGNPDDSGERWVRSRETNLGDLTADSMYWFFNERIGLDCDVAIQNGGGIRSQIDKGDITELTLKQVEPFGNMVCLISASGQQIVDALEMGALVCGEWDEQAGTFAENGGFLQVAGLSYTIDASVKSNVVLDDNDLFDSVDGDYKVKDVEIYNRESGKYEPIDLAKEYQLAGINYLLRNSGNGYSMFASNEMTIDYVGLDYVILSEYVKSFAMDGDFPLVNTKNSPLAEYKGYLLDYEKPEGAGRINIIVED